MTLSHFFALNVDPSQAVPGSYNYTLVLLSYLVAALGSYAFLQFATRIAELRDAGLRFSWLAIGAIAMGGGIWAMHFIGMLAHILPIPVSYDPGITALSIVPAILAAGVALHVVARPVVTTPRLLVGGTLMGVGHRRHALHRHVGDAAQRAGALRPDPVRGLDRRRRAARHPRPAGARMDQPHAPHAASADARDGGRADPGLRRDRDALHGDGVDLLLATTGGRRTSTPMSIDSAFAAVIALIASLVLLLAHRRRDLRPARRAGGQHARRSGGQPPADQRAAFPGAEDGGGRPADRRRGARLQQHPDDRARQRRRHPRGRGGAAAHRQARAADLRRRTEGLRADPPAAGVLAQADPEAGESDLSDLVASHRPAAAAHARASTSSYRPSAPPICGRPMSIAPRSRPR